MTLTSEFTAAQTREYHSTLDTTLTEEETNRRELRGVERLIQEETARGGTYIRVWIQPNMSQQVQEVLTKAGYTLSPAPDDRSTYIQW